MLAGSACALPAAVSLSAGADDEQAESARALIARAATVPSERLRDMCVFSVLLGGYWLVVGAGAASAATVTTL